uniref:Uncharacterized protein n=1 Tax=Rhizophora mucronata TaxID=61149 RepID=A0A2P2QBW0_RHIMU
MNILQGPCFLLPPFLFLLFSFTAMHQ